MLNESEASRVALIGELYQKIGGIPDDLIIKPSKEFFRVNYRVLRGEKEETINRRDLDDTEDQPARERILYTLKRLL